MIENYRVIHFVGIGGVGMSGIAEVLANLGYEVTGSDLKESETTRRLMEMGIRISLGHNAENVDTARVVVVSSAVSLDNPEVKAARRKNIPVIPRAEMLAELVRLKYGVLVAGAHGKTTTTSLISTVLGHGGLDPTIIIGGKLKGIGSNARLGQGEYLVAEADESDGSFLKLSPTIAVVTNIDREHMDFFRSMDKLREAFLSFINKVPFYGVSLICAENEDLKGLIPGIHRRYLTYGFGSSSDIHAADIRKAFMSTSFEVFFHQERIGSFNLPLPGTHNILNALACIGVALELRIEPEKIREGLAAFSGIQRRFEFKGEAGGIKVYDDYGHHPTEIRATLSAARENMNYEGGDGRLFVIFQPHRYTRTADLMRDFPGALNGPDRLILLDIYPAGEKAIEGVNSRVLQGEINRLGGSGALYCQNWAEAQKYVLSEMKRGDILLTLGAGDVWRLGERILEALHAN